MPYITPEEYAEAERNGISAVTLEYRLRYAKRPWDRKRAVTESPNNRSKWRKVADEHGIPPKLFYTRLCRGWDEERAATESVEESLKNVQMGKRTWTVEQEQFLRDNYKNHTEKELADMLGKSYGAVKSKKAKLGLKRWKK